MASFLALVQIILIDLSLAGDNAVVIGVAVAALCPLLPQAAANRPAVTAMAAPFIRLMVLAPHSVVRQALRLSDNGTPDCRSPRLCSGHVT